MHKMVRNSIESAFQTNNRHDIVMITQQSHAERQQSHAKRLFCVNVYIEMGVVGLRTKWLNSHEMTKLSKQSNSTVAQTFELRTYGTW